MTGAIRAGDAVVVNRAWYGGPVEEEVGTVQRIDTLTLSFLVMFPDDSRDWFPPVSVRKANDGADA